MHTEFTLNIKNKKKLLKKVFLICIYFFYFNDDTTFLGTISDNYFFKLLITIFLNLKNSSFTHIRKFYITKLL